MEDVDDVVVVVVVVVVVLAAECSHDSCDAARSVGPPAFGSVIENEADGDGDGDGSAAVCATAAGDEERDDAVAVAPTACSKRDTRNWRDITSCGLGARKAL